MKEICFLLLIVTLSITPVFGGEQLKGRITGPGGTYHYYEKDSQDTDYMKHYNEGQRQAHNNQLLELERQNLLIQQGYVAYGCKIAKKWLPDKNLTVWIRPDGYYITESGYENHAAVKNLVNTVVERKSNNYRSIEELGGPYKSWGY